MLQPQEAENLSIIQHKPDFLEPVKAPIPPAGSKVEIEEGPFKGLAGEVMENSNATYLIVRVEAIGQAARVRLPAVSVKVTG